MISRVADNLTMQASNLVTTIVRSDAVAMGDYNLAMGVVVIHALEVPAGNTGLLTITPEYSNDGQYWAPDSSSIVSLGTASATPTLTTGFNPMTAYVRYKMEFDAADTGTDVAAGFVTFDLIVRYSNQ